MRGFLKAIFPENSAIRWILSGFYRHHFLFFGALLKTISANHELTKHIFTFQVRLGVGQSLKVSLSSSSTVELGGIVTIENWGGNSEISSIYLSDNAALIIKGDLIIGPGVHISVSNNAKLEFAGKNTSSASGVTCNSRIMVEKFVSIGADTIIAWDVFITDSDWHDISGSQRCLPTIIGESVWVAHGVSILKGAVVPDGCIVGAKSLVISSNYFEKSMIAGVPAKTIRRDVSWKR